MRQNGGGGNRSEGSLIARHGLARPQPLPRAAAAQARRLVLPPGTLVLGLTCLTFFVGIAVVSNAIPNPTTTWWTTALFLGFALMALALVLAYFLEAHEVSDDGLASRNVVGITKRLRWSDLGDVRYAPFMRWFRLEARSGGVARVSANTIKGQATIPKAIREHLGLKLGDRVKFFVHPDGSVVLLPKLPASALRGIVKARRTIRGEATPPACRLPWSRRARLAKGKRRTRRSPGRPC